MIVKIILVIAFIALVAYIVRDQRKHMKGEGGGCCGKTERVPRKKLAGRILGRKRIKVSGMHCVNCENHVSFALNAIDGLATVRASAGKGEVLVEFEKPIDDAEIRSAIEGEKFEMISIEEV